MNNFTELFAYIKADLQRNLGFKFKFLVILFRLSNFYYQSGLFYSKVFILFIPLYRIYSELLLSIELPPQTTIGKGIAIRHGFGLVVHKNAEIGDDCFLRHGVTIGNKGTSSGAEVPKIGANVQIGANAIILGEITIGDNVTIGAGTVITKSVDDNQTIVNATNRILK